MQAATAGVLWALDRGTFRAIVVAATMQKRVQNESILDNMAVFASLTPENRAAIADCLTPQVGVVACAEAGLGGVSGCSIADHLRRASKSLGRAVWEGRALNTVSACLDRRHGVALSLQCSLCDDVAREPFWCLQGFQQGDYVLKEGEELGSDAKFYLIASGTVTCHKTFEVGTKGVASADMSLAALGSNHLTSGGVCH